MTQLNSVPLPMYLLQFSTYSQLFNWIKKDEIIFPNWILSKSYVPETKQGKKNHIPQNPLKSLQIGNYCDFVEILTKNFKNRLNVVRKWQNFDNLWTIFENFHFFWSLNIVGQNLILLPPPQILDCFISVSTYVVLLPKNEIFSCLLLSISHLSHLSHISSSFPSFHLTISFSVGRLQTIEF